MCLTYKVETITIFIINATKTYQKHNTNYGNNKFYKYLCFLRSSLWSFVVVFTVCYFKCLRCVRNVSFDFIFVYIRRLLFILKWLCVIHMCERDCVCAMHVHDLRGKTCDEPERMWETEQERENDERLREKKISKTENR